ncbi:hypothetical protein RCL_jg27917.t1 [Rhizophagus clarus]|uniref:Uncharacterized protein n=1 Tax=Rhizophagus clarus TaxID=94130 RepID=A0A8H3M128_9GLOM|nr:hypothetical protein RCL_jg27917.t1 [Rhizophagus clarus]
MSYRVKIDTLALVLQDRKCVKGKKEHLKKRNIWKTWINALCLSRNIPKLYSHLPKFGEVKKRTLKYKYGNLKFGAISENTFFLSILI